VRQRSTAQLTAAAKHEMSLLMVYYIHNSLSLNSKFVSLIKSIRNDFSSGRLSFRYCCNCY
jgi:hypothetical protein